MKKTLLISVFVALFLISAKSQTYFNNEFSNDSSFSSASTMVHSLNDTSGYLVVGQVYINSTPTWYLRFIRLDVLGDTVWTKIYGEYNRIKRTNLPKIISLGDTNFVFIGQNYIDTVNPNQSNSKIVLYKIDLNGSVLWDFEFGDNNVENTATDIQKTADGGFIITGWTTGWGNVNAYSSFLLKVDSSGVEQWYKIYGGNDKASYSVDTTLGNGYIISGFIYVSTVTKYDIHVIKTDSVGNPIWSQSYGSPDNDELSSFITNYNNSGDYILVGGIDILPGNVPRDYQGYIARISGINGAIVWSDTMGIEQQFVFDEFTSNVIVLANGDIVGIGRTYYQATTDAQEAWVIKYNGSGQIIWQRNFNNHGADNKNYLYDIKQTTDGGFVMCGDASDNSIPEQLSWVLKLDSMGCQIVNCSVGINDEIASGKKLLVYPNPSHTIVNFELPFSSNSKSAQLLLFDITGKEVFAKKVITSTTQIDVSNYPKGIYFYQLITNKERFTGKLIVN